MAENSKIEWTDHTFNPWIGCTKVAPGCAHCYAESYANRYGRAVWGPSGTRVKTSDAYWRTPLRWELDAKRGGTRPRVFCASLADVFEDWQGEILTSKGMVAGCCAECGNHSEKDCKHGGAASRRDLTMDDLRRDLFALIDATPNLDWLLLTKRPENVRRMWVYKDDQAEAKRLAGDGVEAHPYYRQNVWLLTSISDQQTADRNIPELLSCRDLVPVLGLSCEPLLGPVDLFGWGDQAAIPPDEGNCPRTWGEYQWPDWVPVDQRKHIEEFWSEGHGRRPASWMHDNVAQRAPATGAYVSFEVERSGWAHLNKMRHHARKGRYLHCWNNVGRIITDEGETVPCSVSSSGWLVKWLCRDGEYRHKIDWVIAGGESGPGARPMHPDWARSIRDECAAAGVPFFFKQWGEWAPVDRDVIEENDLHFGQWHDNPSQFIEGCICEECRVPMAKVGKKAAGRLLDGREHNDLPTPNSQLPTRTG